LDKGLEIKYRELNCTSSTHFQMYSGLYFFVNVILISYYSFKTFKIITCAKNLLAVIDVIFCCVSSDNHINTSDCNINYAHVLQFQNKHKEYGQRWSYTRLYNGNWSV